MRFKFYFSSLDWFHKLCLSIFISSMLLWLNNELFGGNNNTIINRDLHPNCSTLTEDQFWKMMDLRKENIREMCEIYYRSGFKFPYRIDWEKFDKGRSCRQDEWYCDLFVYDKYKLLYKSVQNTGSDILKEYLSNYEQVNHNYTYSGHENARRADVSREGMKAFEKLTDRESARGAISNNYKLVMFRDPLERLLSSYRSLFGGDNEYNTLIVNEPEMIKLLRGMNVSEHQVMTGQIPHISVLDYLSYMHKQDSSMDLGVHLRPQILQALPCSMKYDFIGSMEDMTCEMSFLMKRVTGSYPRSPLLGKPERLKDNYGRLLKDVPIEIVVSVLRKHFKIDYEFLDLPFPRLSNLV